MEQILINNQNKLIDEYEELISLYERKDEEKNSDSQFQKSIKSINFTKNEYEHLMRSYDNGEI